jgi:hypothetical protein
MWVCKNDCNEHDDFVPEMWESRKDLIVHLCSPADKDLKLGEREPKVYVGGDQDTEVTGPWCSGCQESVTWEAARCEHGRHFSGAGACPQCGGGAE